jgi:hypothetical protein
MGSRLEGNLSRRRRWRRQVEAEELSLSRCSITWPGTERGSRGGRLPGSKGAGSSQRRPELVLDVSPPELDIRPE